jgi:hypothetical protein
MSLCTTEQAIEEIRYRKEHGMLECAISAQTHCSSVLR